MKLAPAALNLVSLLNQSWSLVLSLQHTETILLSLQRQDPSNAELYQMLSRQNQLLRERLLALREGWDKSQHNAPPSMGRLQTELQSLNPLAQVHCQLVGWLAQGDASNGGPKFDLPQSPTPSPSPSPAQDSKGQAVPALGFD